MIHYTKSQVDFSTELCNGYLRMGGSEDLSRSQKIQPLLRLRYLDQNSYRLLIISHAILFFPMGNHNNKR